MKTLKTTSFVLVTTAKNEEEYIEKTILAVLSQTKLPKKWIIVNDCSTDLTSDLVRLYSNRYDFIDLVDVEENRGRNFASKVFAFNIGYAKLKNIEYDFIGNLDADVTFDPGYYEGVINIFNENHALGIVGGYIYEKVNEKFKERPGNRLTSIAGAVQLFSRACFEDVGGYMALKYGGEDTIAQFSACMHGWKIQAFPEFPVFHNRRTGSAGTNIYIGRFRQGVSDYFIAYHPLYEMIKSFIRVNEKPYFFGSLLRIMGYFYNYFKREKLSIPPDLSKYIKREQMSKFKLIRNS